MSHAQALADFAQRRASGREESAQQSIPIGLLQPSLLALSTTTQPLKDPGQLGRYRGLSLAKEATCAIDQIDITPERKTLRHAFTRRIQPSAVLGLMFVVFHPQQLRRFGLDGGQFHRITAERLVVGV